jgi:glycogen synthase
LKAPPIRRALIIVQSTALGGMERNSTEVVAELARRGVAVMAVVPPGPSFDPVADALQRDSVEVLRVLTDARHGRAAQLGGLARLARTAHSFAPDVVHLQVGGATGGLAPVLMARLATRAVVVVTEHDVPSADPGPWQRLTRGMMDRALHALIAISRLNARARRERLGAPAGKFAVVLNGVDLPALTLSETAANRERIRSELRLSAAETVIGSVVRLVPNKGLTTLLRAFALVTAQLDARLLLVGGGPMEAELRSFAADLGIQDRVTMVGHQPGPSCYVDAMDVFVLPVPVGSGSIALIEAMARGCAPVITFGDGEEAVIHERTGLWSPPENHEALAAAMLRLCSDSALRDRLGAEAAGHVSRHYSIRRNTDDLLDIYLGARRGSIPAGLRATDPKDPQPGSRRLNSLRAS